MPRIRRVTAQPRLRPMSPDLRNTNCEYDSLPQDRYIRYLILNPGKDEEPLTGRLVTEHIDKVPEFEAISYVWGCPDKIGQIKCDGNIIHLTTSLQVVLRRVRRPDTPRNLWADQICINQDDLSERSHQVGLMSDIYRKASSTLVWLGEATDGDADDVISLITEVEQVVMAKLKEVNGVWLDMPHVSVRDPIAFDPRWVSLARLTSSKWFRRVWVVQEAGLSARPQILYGNRVIDWELCCGVLGWVRRRGLLITQNFRIGWNTIHLDRVPIWSKTEQNEEQVQEAGETRLNPPHSQWGLLDVLHETRLLETTDDRDKIYAFLGHRSASHALNGELIVTPDYTVDVARVYVDFAIRWLEWTQDLNILAYVKHPYGDFIPGSIPTWIPMWNTISFHVLVQRGRKKFKAGMPNKTQFHVIKDGNFLNVQGVIFDTVCYASQSFENGDFESWYRGKPGKGNTKGLHKWVNILHHVLEFSDFCVYQPNEQLMECAMTVVAGLHSRPPQDFEPDAAAFLFECLAAMESSVDPLHTQILEKVAEGGDSRQYEFETQFTLPGRRFITTEKGYYGLAPSNAKEGDSCCVLFGAKTPFIIRSVAHLPGHYEFLGEAYVHGLMHGEIARKCSDGLFQQEDIILV